MVGPRRRCSEWGWLVGPGRRVPAIARQTVPAVATPVDPARRGTDRTRRRRTRPYGSDDVQEKHMVTGLAIRDVTQVFDRVGHLKAGTSVIDTCPGRMIIWAHHAR